jgi:hypothetical protein
MAFPDTMPLGEARQWLREQVKGKGASCPCCTQLAKVYERSLGAGQAALLVQWWAKYRREPVKLSAVLHTPGGDYAKLRWWGLIEDMRDRREDGGSAGVWRITEHGEAFVRGRVTVPRHAKVYDNRFQGFDAGTPQVTVRDVLGEKFDYDELMATPGGDVEPLG